MFNLYMTSESETKLKSLFTNLKNFYVLDVQKFVKSLNLDMSKPSSVFLINDEIEKTILTQSKLKKYKGIIYINKALSENILQAFQQYFAKIDSDIRFILIDNHYIPKHMDIMHLFSQVIFFDRFKKNKIIEAENLINQS